MLKEKDKDFWKRPEKINFFKEWYIPKLEKTWKPSSAEEQIRKILQGMKINFKQEVAFKFLGHPSKPLRFDFVLFDYKTIIEYDGCHHETNKIIINNDSFKNEFCRINEVNLIRLNKKDFFNLEEAITFHLSKLKPVYKNVQIQPLKITEKKKVVQKPNRPKISKQSLGKLAKGEVIYLPEGVTGSNLFNMKKKKKKELVGKDRYIQSRYDNLRKQGKIA